MQRLLEWDIKCVYNRIEDDGSQSTLLVHVDDVLVTAKDEMRVDNIMDEIEELFEEVKSSELCCIDFRFQNIKDCENNYARVHRRPHGVCRKEK